VATETGADLRIVLFPTCLVDLLFPRAAESAERVLERAGCEVGWREGAVCCGQPAWNSGHVSEARRVAAEALEALAGEEPIVMCSGSCATMVHEYWPQLFEGTEHESEAQQVAHRTRELSSFLADDIGVELLGALETAPTRVTYHDSCHMLRGLGVKHAARRLLGAIEGLELAEMEEPERCCGFGGTFSIRYPELSASMADVKVDDALAQNVDTVVASDAGCLMHICGRARARGDTLHGRYIAEVLDDAAADR
jgi:L-lactate dehydrogenase complex protein LldE